MISRGTVSGTALSRVTLVGERRRVDPVLPSREPVGLLLPEVLRLLDDRVGERPQARHLVAADGSALEPDDTLESAGVPDGAVLRLVRVVVSAVALGVLPRPALTASGLSGLDDRRAAGTPVSRHRVGTALAATHRGFALATVVTAVSGAVAAVLSVRTVTVWTVLPAVLSLGVLAVRPAEHVRVRLRKAGDVPESAGVIALFPLVLGVFGVYGRLLGTFA